MLFLLNLMLWTSASLGQLYSILLSKSIYETCGCFLQKPSKRSQSIVQYDNDNYRNNVCISHLTYYRRLDVFNYSLLYVLKYTSTLFFFFSNKI